MGGHHDHSHDHRHGEGAPPHLHADHPAAECEGPGASLERRRSERRGLTFALAVTAAIFVLELAGGLISGSLALQADAGHLFADVVGLSISLAGIAIAQRPVDSRRTWGYYRLEILSALANGVLLGVAAVMILR
ncbi:MAG TPA: cation diffusion facilitator family transporter, partial [bacterium]|nr:cation diffusion facilitator family transporter [bacterium]